MKEGSDSTAVITHDRSYGGAITSQVYFTFMSDSVTAGHDVLEGRSNKCDTIDSSYNVPLAIICTMCFVFGIVHTFFGYRFFKVAMFLTGFMFSSILVYMICLEEKVFTPMINAGISVGAGFVSGLLSMLVQYVGLFLTGFNFGVSVAVGILIVLEQFLQPDTRWIPIGLSIGIGIICALLTLKFQKLGTILGTSIFGGILMISCIDYFIEQFLLMSYIWDRMKVQFSSVPCWYSWIMLGCWPFCFLVGVITQWKITSQGFNHQETFHNRGSHSLNLKYTRSKDKPKECPRQSRYRYLYQVRRVKGDVISKDYIQSIQSKLSPSLRSLTSVPTEPLELESTNTTLTGIPEV